MVTLKVDFEGTGYWAPFGFHFACRVRVLELLGTLLGAPCAPGVAWIHFRREVGSQKKRDPKLLIV